MLYEHAFTSRDHDARPLAALQDSGGQANRLKQARDAQRLLQALRVLVLTRRTPLHGYAHAAGLIGRGANESAHVGQVCSRIDLACFRAGLPALTLHWVRKPDGEINHEALAGWRAYAQELIAAACSHGWTAPDLDAVQRELDALPNRSAAALWLAIEAEGAVAIRRQLHCALHAR